MFTNRSKAVLLLCINYVISVLYLLCFCAPLFIDALWSPAGNGKFGSCIFCNFLKEGIVKPSETSKC